MRTDVIIPVYKPGPELYDLLDRLEKQSRPVQKIILMNTEERYFQELAGETDFAERYPNVEVHHVSKQDFDHGGTRRLGVEYSDADFFVAMTQDAMPAATFPVRQSVSRSTSFPSTGMASWVMAKIGRAHV